MYRSFHDHREFIHIFSELDEVEPLWSELAGTPGPRSVLVAAHRIQQLKNICLASMLARLHEVEAGRLGRTNRVDVPRPKHLILELEELCGPHALWAPSWVERVRVREALWHIMTGCYSRMIPGMPTEGISRGNQKDWCAMLKDMIRVDRNAVAGEWNRGYQRGDPLDCVFYTLWDVLGCSPMWLFTGNATRAEVRHALDRILDVMRESLGFATD